MALFQLIQKDEEYPYRPRDGVTLWYRRFDAHTLGEIGETVLEKFGERTRNRAGQWERRVPTEKQAEYGRALSEEILDRAIVKWEGLGNNPHDQTQEAPCTREWKLALPGAWIEAVLELARGGADVDPTRASGMLSNGN
jgi:hypothetical protein